MRPNLGILLPLPVLLNSCFPPGDLNGSFVFELLFMFELVFSCVVFALALENEFWLLMLTLGCGRTSTSFRSLECSPNEGILLGVAILVLVAMDGLGLKISGLLPPPRTICWSVLLFSFIWNEDVSEGNLGIRLLKLKGGGGDVQLSSSLIMLLLFLVTINE